MTWLGEMGILSSMWTTLLNPGVWSPTSSAAAHRENPYPSSVMGQSGWNSELTGSARNSKPGSSRAVIQRWIIPRFTGECGVLWREILSYCVRRKPSTRPRFSSIWTRVEMCLLRINIQAYSYIMGGFLSPESEKDGPELIDLSIQQWERQAVKACDNLEKKYFWRLRKEREKTSKHFCKLPLISKSVVKLRLTLIAIGCGPEKCVFPEVFWKLLY